MSSMPCEKAGLIEEAVIDGDIEAAVGLGIKEAFEAEGFHPHQDQLRWHGAT
jgi:hypothetical protein